MLVPRARRPSATFAVTLTALLVVAWGPLASPALAHATLLSTSPVGDQLVNDAPSQVELHFDEPVQVVTGGVRVLDPTGGRADRGRVDSGDGGATVVVPIDANRQGTYTVAWRVLSEDSHDLSGSFVFHVREKTGGASIASDADRVVEVAGFLGRWLAFTGAVLAVGMAVVATTARAEPRARSRLRQPVVLSGLAAAIGVGLVLVTQAADASGRSLFGAVSLVFELSSQTRTGRLTAARGLMAAAIVGLAAPTRLWHRAPWAAAGAGAVSLMTLSFSGHAWTSPNRLLGTACDIVHVLAVATWIGGVAALVIAVPVAVDRVVLVKRFSAVALVLVVVVAVTGTVSAVLELGSFSALTGTSYGKLVIVKAAGFAILVWLGWVNRAHLIPLLERTATPLRRALRAELVVAAIVLAATAVLVNQPPGRTALVQPFSGRSTESGVTLQLDVQPAQTGTNELHLYFYDATGSQSAPVDAVEVTAAIGDVPPRKLVVTPITPSHVSVYGASLNSPGAWKLRVTALLRGTPVVFNFDVPVR